MMKRLLCAAVGLLAAGSAFAQNVGVTVTVGQPGFYGVLDINNYPQPQVIYTKPAVIHPVPVGVVYEPLYLYVPPGHAKHWSKHCAKYDACGRPVYFVKEKYYRDVYVPRYREYHDHGGHGHGNGHGNDDDQGHGHGKGKGKGHKDD